MAKSFYGKRASNQGASILSSMNMGINEYTPATEINDGALSDLMNVFPYKDSVLEFSVNDTVTPIMAYDDTKKGTAMASIAFRLPSGQECIGSLVNYGTDWYVDVVSTMTAGRSRRTLTAGKVPPAPVAPETNVYQYSYGACLFSTQAYNYVVFSCDRAEYLWGIKIPTTGALSYTLFEVALPTGIAFRRIVSNNNRIFGACRNTLWWCKAGAFDAALAGDWYGGAGATAYVNEDAGYWNVETERFISEMAVLNNVLYLFGTENIHALQGYSYDTFSMSTVIPNFGIMAKSYYKLVTSNGLSCYLATMKFNTTTNDYSPVGMDIWEFNGNSYPALISRPAGNITPSGIVVSDQTWLTCDENYLYVFKRSHLISDNEVAFYKFDIRHRSWWKQSGYTNDMFVDNQDFFVSYIPTSNYDEMFSIISTQYADTDYYYIMNEMGISQTQVPYFVTKSFHSVPSETGSLTDVIVVLSATADDPIEVTLSYSLNAFGDEFIEVKKIAGYIASGDVEYMVIPVPVAAIARAPQYRLKLEMSGSSIKFYGLERRFRMHGRSR